MPMLNPVPLNVALVGIGKIARDQHVPAIRASDDRNLVATVSRSGTVDGVPAFTDIEDMLEARPDVSVVSLCLPPVPRFVAAEAAIRAGRHVMLEKPPGATLAEVHELQAMATARGVSLYATWHSRMAHGVADARTMLSGREILGATITWKEDVRKWHPGQDWVFEPGGMGVFDPGINALSILTAILPDPVHLTSATLTFPENRQTPIAADLVFTGNVTATFDWRQTGPQTWDIVVQTDRGTLTLRKGGSEVETSDGYASSGPDREYPGLYARMATLVRSGTSDVDLSPMVHVADALTLGRRVFTEPFDF